MVFFSHHFTVIAQRIPPALFLPPKRAQWSPRALHAHVHVSDPPPTCSPGRKKTALLFPSYISEQVSAVYIALCAFFVYHTVGIPGF